MKKNDKWQIADTSGKFVCEPCDSISGGYVHNLCAIKRGPKWEYINSLGDLAIETKFDFASPFSNDGLAHVRIGDEVYFINTRGERLLFVDSVITGFSNNRAVVIMNGDKCLIDKSGTKICSINADDISSFSVDGTATLISGGIASKIDTLGNVVLKTDYEDIGEYTDGLAVFKKNGKYGYINKLGDVIIPANYDFAAPTDCESRIRVCKMGNTPVIRINNYLGSNAFVNVIYDLQGNVIWKDISSFPEILPWHKTREDIVDYLDTQQSMLDPIEGIYFMTEKAYYRDKYNLNNVCLISSYSNFMAIIRSYGIRAFNLSTTYNSKDFILYWIDGSGRQWHNKYVKIGQSNTYAVHKRDEDRNCSSEGMVTIDDLTRFEFILELGQDDHYNYFVQYEFTRDYPPIIESVQTGSASWSGTGFAVSDGYIATNFHVTNNANSILIRGINGDFNKRYKGNVVVADENHDIAIIKIVDKDFTTLGRIPYEITSKPIDVGEDIFVLGYPMISSMGEEIKFTEGVVSAASGYKGDVSMYQISAAVQPGNSGGPVYTTEGMLVGIVCGQHSDAENVNYAVKSSYLYDLMDQYGMKLPKAHNKKSKPSHRIKLLKNYVYLIECNN